MTNPVGGPKSPTVSAQKEPSSVQPPQVNTQPQATQVATKPSDSSQYAAPTDSPGGPTIDAPTSTPKLAPLPDEQRAEAAKKVKCPFLGAAVKQGLLTPDVAGNVDIQQIDTVLKKAGLNASTVERGKNLADGLSLPPEVLKHFDGAVQQPHDASVNVFHLANTRIDHKSSTGIREELARTGDEEKAKALFYELFGEQMKNNNGILTQQGMALGLEKAAKKDPDLKGQTITYIEHALLMSSRVASGQGGNTYLTETEALNLFVHSEFPERFLKAPAEPGDVGLPGILSKALQMKAQAAMKKIGL